MSVAQSNNLLAFSQRTPDYCARHALSQGNVTGQTEAGRQGTSFVPATPWKERLIGIGWGCAKAVVPLSIAAATHVLLQPYQLPFAENMVISATMGAAAGMLHASRLTRENAKEFVRIGFTQFSSQLTSALTLKFGFEQLANHLDPSLSTPGFYNGSHWAANETDLFGNSTPAYALDHERLWPGGTAWLSLVVIGLPVAIQFAGLLIPVSGGTTSVDAMVDRLRLDGSGGGKDIRERWSDNTDRWVRAGTKVGLGATGLAIVGGLLATGQRKLAMRILSNANQVQLAARMRDFMNALMRGASSGSPESERWPDSGWRREQQVKIPQAVLDALDAACMDPDTNQRDDGKYNEGLQLLKTWYRNMFIGGRACSMPLYAGASAFGLYVVRDFFAPRIGGAFAADFSQALAVAIPVSLGTAFTEGMEEPGWTAMVTLWSNFNGMPFEIARAPKDPTDKVSANFKAVSMTALLPGHFLIRSAIPSTYGKSQVDTPDNDDPKVNLSLSDRVELNAGIRSFQNMGTMMLLTSGGAAHDPQTKIGFYAAGVLMNAATHFRGNVVAQLLDSGREAHLLHEHAVRNEENMDGKDEVNEPSAEMESVDVI